MIIKGSKLPKTAEELLEEAGQEFGSYDSMMLMRLSMAMSLSSIAKSLDSIAKSLDSIDDSSESLSTLERNKQRRRDEI